jgi:Carboxypeptidase regulatory-like domain
MRTSAGLYAVVAMTVAAALAFPLPAAAASSLTGTVHTAAGTPVASVWVVVLQGGAERGRSLTGDDGRFLIPHLAGGEYQVVVRRGNSQLSRLAVRLPRSRPLDIRLG